MTIFELPTADLIPYENNPRDNDGAVDAVAASIREFGWKVPVVIDKDHVIVAGHTRVKAAKKLGIETVPCIIADDLTEEQVQAFRLVDNKTNELAVWDDALLREELDALSGLDMSVYGFEKMLDGAHEWFENHQRNDDSRQEGNDEYNEFLQKFENPKTTDDCYTPDIVYEAVAAYVEKRYTLNRKKFVRPFYPGGDYQNETYPKDCVVVDNPPFSILAEILDFYNEKGIRYFLFGPSLTIINYSNRCTVVVVGASVIYENKASVSTSFLTNMEGDVAARSDPELFRAVQDAADKYTEELHVSLPKYDYPHCVVTSAMLQKYSKYGESFSVFRDESVLIRSLDAQAAVGKGIYGSGLLISEKAAAEKAAAEKAAAEKAAAENAAATVWTLSDREIELQRSLAKD